MKGNSYIVGDEPVNGRSLGISILINTLVGLVAYGIVFRLALFFTDTPQGRLALSLGAALLSILCATYIINKIWGTHRFLQEDGPSNADIESVLAGFEINTSEELEMIENGPKDINDLANEIGIVNRLKIINSRTESSI